jgi:tRNA-uridine 2-sulfurtransferase
MSGGRRIAVAMSGGVDSSTAAAILKSRGYDLVGFSMQLWDQTRSGPESTEAKAGRCCSLDDLYDARGVAARLGFPFYVVNFQEAFEQTVVRQFVESYREGLTPSPCVLCNSRMKFDHLVRMADEVDAEGVATGHYARVDQDTATGRWRLLRGRDRSKDQSYFLFELTQNQLSRATFPLGDLEKTEVRRLARELGLDVADKPDSQEICFIPDGDYAGFIERHYREITGDSLAGDLGGGDIVDESGRVLGSHPGVHHFTVGQRRGLGVSGAEPLYVIRLDPESRQVVAGGRSQLASRRCRVTRTNWVSIPEPEGPVRVQAQIRSRHKEADAVCHPAGAGEFEVEFDAPQLAVTPGQAIVLYQGDLVLGGGWIARDCS